MTIAILGGTGDLGTGLAKRLSRADYRVIIGSRKLAKAEKAAEALAAKRVKAMTNQDAAEACDMAILTVPFKHQINTLKDLKSRLKGKILVDSTVPLRPPRVGIVQLPKEGSAVLLAQQALGKNVKVVSAFQNIAAHLLESEQDIEGDVLVAGDNRKACDQVCDLAEAIGLRAWYIGSLANSAAAEALTSVLIQLNRQGLSNAGIKIVSQ